MSKRMILSVIVTSIMVLALAAGCAALTAAPVAKKKLKVFGAFATPIEEPWDGAINTALTAAKTAGEIDYTFTDNIGTASDMERILRQVADQQPFETRNRVTLCSCGLSKIKPLCDGSHRPPDPKKD